MTLRPHVVENGEDSMSDNSSAGKIAEPASPQPYLDRAANHTLEVASDSAPQLQLLGPASHLAQLLPPNEPSIQEVLRPQLQRLLLSRPDLVHFLQGMLASVQPPTAAQLPTPVTQLPSDSQRADARPASGGSAPPTRTNPTWPPCEGSDAAPSLNGGEDLSPTTAPPRPPRLQGAFPNGMSRMAALAAVANAPGGFDWLQPPLVAKAPTAAETPTAPAGSSHRLSPPVASTPFILPGDDLPTDRLQALAQAAAVLAGWAAEGPDLLLSAAVAGGSDRRPRSRGGEAAMRHLRASRLMEPNHAPGQCR